MLLAQKFEFGVTPFYFLRHGETNENKNGIVQGQNDTDLNASGRRHAEEAGERLVGAGLGSIYASPLKRTMRTASIVSTLTRVPIFRVPGLMERHWGEFQGRRKDQRPDDPNPPTVETVKDFSARVLAALGSIIGPAPVLVVAHSGVFRVLCGHGGLPADRRVSTTSAQPLYFEPASAPGQQWRISEVQG